MILIGNDLYNISENQSTFCRTRAKNIILNKSELLRFSNIIDLNNTLATLWTIKESSYKISCKQGNTNAFSPQQFSVNSYNITNNFLCGNVNYKKFTYSFFTFLKHNYIFTTTCTNNDYLKQIKHKVFKNNSSQESINNLSLIKYCETNKLIIKKNKFNIPIVINNKNIDLSITHDKNILIISVINNNEKAI